MVWSTNRVELRVDVVGVLDLPLEAREDSIRGLFGKTSVQTRHDPSGRCRLTLSKQPSLIWLRIRTKPAEKKIEASGRTRCKNEMKKRARLTVVLLPEDLRKMHHLQARREEPKLVSVTRRSEEERSVRGLTFGTQAFQDRASNAKFMTPF